MIAKSVRIGKIDKVRYQAKRTKFTLSRALYSTGSDYLQPNYQLWAALAVEVHLIYSEATLVGTVVNPQVALQFTRLGGHKNSCL